MKIRTIAISLALLLFAFPACDTLSSDPEPTGHLDLHLTDAESFQSTEDGDNPFPVDLVDEANVTISQAEILSTGLENVFVLTSETHEDINLLELQDGVTMLLGARELPAGSYTQIRLYVEDASVVMNDDEGTVYDLDVPSGAQSGINIPLGNFEIEEEGDHELTLGFDVQDSFVVQGDPHSHESIEGFIFEPVVRPVGLEPPTPGEPTIQN